MSVLAYFLTAYEQRNRFVNVLSRNYFVSHCSVARNWIDNFQVNNICKEITSIDKSI